MEKAVFDMFPLPLVVIEKEEVRLHIFEKRYINLIQRAVANKTPFGIPVVADNGMKPTGAMVRMVKVQKVYPGGEMDIVVKCDSRFRITDFFESSDSEECATAEIETLRFSDNENKEYNLRLFDLLMEFYSLSGIEIPEFVFRQSAIHEYYHKCGLSFTNEYEFANLKSTAERQNFLLHHLNSLIPLLAEISRMKAKISLNGHFKKLPQSF